MLEKKKLVSPQSADKREGNCSISNIVCMEQDLGAEGDYLMTNQNLLSISWVQSTGQGWGQVCGDSDRG